MKSDKKIGIIDFGGQYAHLISSRIRRLGSYTEILSNSESLDRYKEFSGLVFSGGPNSVYEEKSPSIPKEIFELNIPILGICYGHQLIMKLLGGVVEPSNLREYGSAIMYFSGKDVPILEGLSNSEKVWMSHGDEVVKIPKDFISIGKSSNCENAAVYNLKKNIYGIQFHPEVTHTLNGNVLLSNFIKLCGTKSTWNMEIFLERKLDEIKKKVPMERKVFMLISGGVDSTVSYLLLAKALGKDRVTGLLIDTGFMRKEEVSSLKGKLGSLGIDLNVRDYSEMFYSSLQDIKDPELKRNIIGELFLKCQKESSISLNLNPDHWILGQGTIYPDTIESGGTKLSKKIKTHHNRVQGITDLIEKGLVIEPISDLYKDEVRELGKLLGLEKEFTDRHPFPGPGLAVRMIAHNHFTKTPHEEEALDEILKYYKGVEFQILPVRSVGVQGDNRTYGHCIALNDFTNDWNAYEEISTKITNTVKGINRVVFCPYIKSLSFNKFQKSNLELNRMYSDLLREADDAVFRIIEKHHLIEKIWQMPVVLLPVGNSEDCLSIVLRPVESTEAMTANFYCMDRKVLEEIHREVLKIERLSILLYDITNKPPGTIEWE
ncbi:MAG: glutamine-hydrolyzing GMP synthase [Leptospiraceae bacterium]|nr:glutamine-hydrolyzing GMP synthase [Leptospiraceae bacterium]MCK6381560.1 glutamine-hydrolyzing GMP synthase [Leptospiraceae bacterium]NUM42147.1 glutamine-hydrolyzing GMP synthase [Leptospiraceae bacterium]